MTTGHNIGELAKKNKINLHQLSKMAGVSYNTLYSIVRRKSDKVDHETVRKIALALGVHPMEIYGDSALGLIDYGMDLFARALETPGISGDLVEGRICYDAFVLDNKKKAIYYQAVEGA